ncbi:MAG: DUF2721 domain-containing protein [Ktedonobacterales bacterium]
MTLQSVQNAIATILAPVVMITSCAILLGGMLAQYGSVNDRLRAFARERLELLRTPEGGLAPVAEQGDFARERLREIDAQVPGVLRRHQLIHNALLLMYAAVLIFVLTMIVIAGAYQQHSGALATAAMVLFLLGVATLLSGVALFAIYIRGSNDAVQYEMRRILGLGK